MEKVRKSAMLYDVDEGVIRKIECEGEVLEVDPPIDLRYMDIAKAKSFLRRYSKLVMHHRQQQQQESEPETDESESDESEVSPEDWQDEYRAAQKKVQELNLDISAKSTHDKLIETIEDALSESEDETDEFQAPDSIVDKVSYKSFDRDLVREVLDTIPDHSTQMIKKSELVEEIGPDVERKLSSLLRCLREVGVVDMPKRGKYQRVFPEDELEELAKKYAYLTPDHLVKHLWVSPDDAEGYLWELEERNIVEHQPKEENFRWTGADQVKEHLKELNANNVEVESGENSDHVGVTLPNPDEFEFQKKSSQCRGCEHNYQHAWVRGSLELCTSCYRAIGGETQREPELGRTSID